MQSYRFENNFPTWKKAHECSSVGYVSASNSELTIMNYHLEIAFKLCEWQFSKNTGPFKASLLGIPVQV